MIVPVKYLLYRVLEVQGCIRKEDFERLVFRVSGCMAASIVNGVDELRRDLRHVVEAGVRRGIIADMGDHVCAVPGEEELIRISRELYDEFWYLSSVERCL